MSVTLIVREHHLGPDLDRLHAVVVGAVPNVQKPGDLYVVENVPVNVPAEAFIADLQHIGPEWETNDRHKDFGPNAWVVWADDGYDENGMIDMSIPLYARPLSAYTDYRTAHAVVRKIEGYREYGTKPGEWPEFIAAVTKVPVIGSR